VSQEPDPTTTIFEKPRFDNRDAVTKEREKLESAKAMLIAAEVDVIRYRTLFADALKNFEAFIRDDERDKR